MKPSKKTRQYLDVMDCLEHEMMVDYKKTKCEHCKTMENLTIHHIKPRSKYPHLKAVPSNLMTLCIKCHRKVHKDNGKGRRCKKT